MNTELQVVPGGTPLDIARQANTMMQEQIELLKRTICQGASDDEFALFLSRAQRTGLDPFARQIHAVKRWDPQLGRETMSIQVGIDGFRLIAERTGDYAPGREPTFEYGQNGELLSATAYVRKWARGEWHEVAATAFYDEYIQTKRDGKPVAMWAKMPRGQLAKCAEALALRRGFPQDLGGIYTPDEMGQADSEGQAPARNSAPVAPRADDHLQDGNSQAMKWEKLRGGIITTVKAMTESRRNYWLGEMQKRLGNRTLAKTSIAQLEAFKTDIAHAEASRAAAGSMQPSDDVIDAQVRDEQPATFGETVRAKAGVSTDSAQVTALRGRINILAMQQWPAPETRGMHLQEFTRAHFGVEEFTACGDADTLQRICDALQGKLNSAAALAASNELTMAGTGDDLDDPFAE